MDVVTALDPTDGLTPELMGVSELGAKFNENHDPVTGQFASGGAGGGRAVPAPTGNAKRDLSDARRALRQAKTALAKQEAGYDASEGGRAVLDGAREDAAWAQRWVDAAEAGAKEFGEDTTAGSKHGDHDQSDHGNWARGGGGAGGAPIANSPVDVHSEPGTAAWTREVVVAIEQGHDPTIATSDLPTLLTNMSYLQGHPDITELNLGGTRLMGGEGMGIPRAKMPQIPPEARDQFIADLRKSGVSVTEERIDPLLLKPIQTEVSGARAGAIYKRFEKTGIPDGERILVTRDNFIVDGHHTWAAGVGLHYAGTSDDMPVFRMGLSARDALDQSLAWAVEHGHVYDATKELLEPGEKVDTVAEAADANPNRTDVESPVDQARLDYEAEVGARIASGLAQARRAVSALLAGTREVEAREVGEKHGEHDGETHDGEMHDGETQDDEGGRD
jgi:hypothetical protein